MSPRTLESNPVLQEACKKSFYNNPDAILVTDNRGIIRYHNEASLTMFGYESQELVNQQIGILIPDALRNQHKAKFESYTRAPHPRKMSNDMGLKAIRKDGTGFFISISLQSFTEANQPYFMAVIRDTSEYMMKNEQLSRVMKISKIGTWELDHLSNKLVWADEVYDLFEVNNESFFPSLETFISLIYEDDQKMVHQAFLDSLKNKIPYNIVHRILLPHGEIRFLRERCETVFSSDGTPLKSLGSVQDVTEVQKQKILLKNYLRDLQRKNQELEGYTYIAAHDLQEPLNTILGVSNLLKEEMQQEDIKNAEIPSYLQFIEDSSLRLKSLIKGIMDTARLGKSREYHPVDLHQVIEETIADLGNQISRSKASINTCNLPVVRAHRLEIKLLFQNLISNALKFRKKEVDPVIRLGCNDQGHEWLFWIEDNGIGIDTSHKDKLFRMFRRLHSGDEYEGTGLGLAQCKKIVELHKGEIWFESKLGEGTVFYFTISKSCCNDTSET